MIFVATDSTADGRITRGGIYKGNLIYVYPINPGLRICVFDNKKEWMTFKPEIFKPLTIQEKVEWPKDMTSQKK